MRGTISYDAYNGLSIVLENYIDLDWIFNSNEIKSTSDCVSTDHGNENSLRFSHINFNS